MLFVFRHGAQTEIYISMARDDLAWEENDKETDTWERSLHKMELYRAIVNFIQKYRPGEAVELHRQIRGGYNIFYGLEHKDGSSAAMRIPSKAMMRCIAAKTTIPVPKIYHFGTAAENPTGLGPFIIMDYIEHDRTISKALKDPALKPEESHALDPNIKFTGMTLPLLPFQPYSISDEWYSALADMHLAQLVFQHNGAVDDEDDATEGQLTSEVELKEDRNRNNKSVFPLYSSDLRPSNVLIDKDLRVVGVIDWEFAYAAPAQLSFDPPWWLLLKSPECKAWMINYAARNSQEFDCIFWRFLDAMYFGPNEEADHLARLGLRTQKQIEAMGPFVKTKMEESKERILVHWDHDSAAAQLAKVMVRSYQQWL
ncbi:hypothetical protein CHU98_g6504 [Xylaria longipes]|nr:hypothetical protein CHU98_g6504 [Xylaria longipes]